MMHAPRWSSRRSALGAALLVSFLAATPGVLRAQVQPQGAPSVVRPVAVTASDAAAVELRSAMTDYYTWSWKSGADHAAKALELDSSFALARVWSGLFAGGPNIAAGARRAISNGANASAAELVLALATRESAAGRTANANRLFDAAVALAPDDPLIATARAENLTDTARIAALRAVADRFPSDAGSRIILAYRLTPTNFVIEPTATANADEALRVAGEAIRLLPDAAGSHTAMGHVLHALGRDAEARKHLEAAAAMTPKMWYTYSVLADIDVRDGRFADARAALDSSLAWDPNLNQRAFSRRAHAAIRFGDGDVAGAMAELGSLVDDLQAANARGELANTHLWMAVLAAGARDSAAALRHIEAGKSFNPGTGLLVDNEVIVHSLLGDAQGSRRALDAYVAFVKSMQNPTPAQTEIATANIHRMTGLTLLAERKPQEAIAELRQGGKNPYATLGIIEAYRMLKQNKQADAERTALFTRREFTVGSTAIEIIRYRAKK